MIKRILNLRNISYSFFLFGPRQVGKTFLVEHTLKPDIFINLLRQNDYLRFSKNFDLLFQEIKALKKDKCQIVIDEIQSLPELLNEIHFILEKMPRVQFILTSSSARKLRKGGVNLLGGRAFLFHLYPLTYEEVKDDFSLEDILLFGSLPRVFQEKDKELKIELLKSYVETYLEEEIKQEALVRKMPSFSKFLDLAAYDSGNIINYQNIANEIGVASKTVREYFYILVDTLLGFFLAPYIRSKRKRLVSHPKFYFFDLGVVNALKGELRRDLMAGTLPYGKAFEHFIILEIKRLLDYHRREFKMFFFRTNDGAEVDLILEVEDVTLAIEIKSSSNPDLSDLRGLKSFLKDHQVDRALCVCLTPRKFMRDRIEFLPWQEFLKDLC